MSLILRLAASLDQRPDKVISSVQIKLQENILTFELLPLNRNHDLLLEKWNLGLCRNVIKELKNLNLKVIQFFLISSWFGVCFWEESENKLKIKDDAISPRKPEIKINIMNPTGLRFLGCLDL